MAKIIEEVDEVAKAMGELQNSINSSLGLQDENLNKNYFEEQSYIPLLTDSSYDSLINKHGTIPESSLIKWKIDTRDAQSRNPMNALMVSGTGTGKTRLVKNIIKAYYKAGYNILFVEPKSFEMVNAKDMGKGVKIHPLDKNSKLPVVSYTPAFVKFRVERFTPERKKLTTFYSHDLSNLVTSDIWESFGVSKKAADGIVTAIKENEGKKLTIDSFKSYIKQMNIMSNTRTASMGALENLEGVNFFNSKDKAIPIKEEWEKGNIVCINYHGDKGVNVCSDLGIILDRVMEIGMQESREGLKKVSKKLLIFDDSFYYCGPYAMGESKGRALNLAALNIGHCQNNARTWGVDTILITQNASSYFIDPILVDSPTYVLCSQVPDTEPLRQKLPEEAFQIISNKHPQGINQQPIEPAPRTRAFHFPWIFVKDRYNFQRGFPFDCSVGHI